MALYCLHIRGLVQGVSYRYSAKVKAEALGIKGVVKNLPDGRVYAEIEGREHQLQAMIAWCKQGPAYAQVDQVEVSLGIEKNYKTFEIIR